MSVHQVRIQPLVTERKIGFVGLPFLFTFAGGIFFCSESARDSMAWGVGIWMTCIGALGLAAAVIAFLVLPSRRSVSVQLYDESLMISDGDECIWQAPCAGLYIQAYEDEDGVVLDLHGPEGRITLWEEDPHWLGSLYSELRASEVAMRRVYALD